MKMETSAVAAKVWAASLAALLTPILLALLAKAFPDVPLPVDASDLIQTIILGLIGSVVTFLAGYFKRPAASDQVVQETPKP